MLMERPADCQAVIVGNHRLLAACDRKRNLPLLHGPKSTQFFDSSSNTDCPCTIGADAA